MTAAEQLRQEGHKQGRREGREEGREEGRREVASEFLLRQLELRFGLTPAVEERVRGASVPTLLTWGERVISATSLDEVFAEPGEPGRPEA